MTTEELKQRIEEYIESHNVCTIAVADGGTPSAHAVYYISRELHIYFESDPASYKIHVLRSNPQISLTINEDYSDWREIRGVQFFGRASILDERDAPKLQEAFLEKFPHINDLGGIPPYHIFVEVVPDKIYFMDFTENFGQKSVYYHEKKSSSKINWR